MLQADIVTIFAIAGLTLIGMTAVTVIFGGSITIRPNSIVAQGEGYLPMQEKQSRECSPF